jgi:hypothetical protein
MRPRLIFSDPDAERVEALRRGIGAHPDLQVIHLKSDQLRKLPELDAIFLTIMAAEAWGAVPFVHRAQVLTNRENRLAGWPTHIVAGVAMDPGDPREPVFELKLIIRAVLEAIKEFNQKFEEPITSIGFSPEWTGINRIDPIKAGRIVREVYDGFC